MYSKSHCFSQQRTPVTVEQVVMSPSFQWRDLKWDAFTPHFQTVYSIGVKHCPYAQDSKLKFHFDNIHREKETREITGFPRLQHNKRWMDRDSWDNVSPDMHPLVLQLPLAWSTSKHSVSHAGGGKLRPRGRKEGNIPGEQQQHSVHILPVHISFLRAELTVLRLDGWSYFSFQTRKSPLWWSLLWMFEINSCRHKTIRVLMQALGRISQTQKLSDITRPIQ